MGALWLLKFLLRINSVNGRLLHVRSQRAMCPKIIEKMASCVNMHRFDVVGSFLKRHIQYWHDTAKGYIMFLTDSQLEAR